MELELGLKMTKTVDDFISATDFLIAKDRSGPLFVSRETDSMFILTAHLKGYKREVVKIEINEDGTRIAVSGEKPVQEMVMIGWNMYKKETEMKGFKKVFKIPDGVILDKIKARFDEEESVLTISMPKAVKGIRGGEVEEVKEEQVLETLPGSSDKKVEQKAESSDSGSQERGTWTIEPTRLAHDQARKEEGVEGEESEREKCSGGFAEPKEDKSGDEIDKIGASRPEQVADLTEDVEPKDEIEKRGTHIEGQEPEDEQDVCRDEPPKREKETSLGDGQTQGKQPPEKRSVICAPIIAGSVLLVSVIVLVFHFIRNRNPPRKNQN